ncbi:DoxX-like family protein [Roseateles oligotrophus]|uniref:DoxX-like family protein n=1 Tax=Roseateles oligotrophus TaxID=1769250 RepID=A0ABT2YKJ6_9BURK|nr:DoxX-like family protein [Roseateles oligotrophus]MCV2370582.1 DoxX-like family protein [Roseateles oligotrophus]
MSRQAAPVVSLARSDTRGLRLSLVFVWLWTGAVSIWELQGQSRVLLLAGGVADLRLASALILGGAALDLLLGAALWFRPSRPVYLLTLAAMLGMTVVATLLSPDLWLHPLGPLSKNLPIAALLCFLARQESR